MNTETITLYKDGEEIVVDVQRVEEFEALGYAATVSEESEDKETKDNAPEDKETKDNAPEDKVGENPEDKAEDKPEDEAKPAGKGRSKGGK